MIARRQQNLCQSIIQSSSSASDPRTTVFIITVGDITLPACQEAIQLQDTQDFVLDIIRDVHPMSAAFQEMIARCRTEYFIQVDEDMILNPTAVRVMENLIHQAPKDIGMLCCHLYDEDREATIQGIKIYRTSAMKSLIFQNVKACEMDLLEQMGQKGIRWALHPSVQGRHGTHYTPETIYRRYKSMYEKDILEWNDVTGDIQRKAKQYRETGNPLALFALLGSVDGIVSAPNAKDREKDFTQYDLKALEVFRRIFLESESFPFPYEAGKAKKRSSNNPPVFLEEVGLQSNSRKTLEEFQVQNRNSLPSHVSGQRIDLPAPNSQKRLLFICHWFWPSVGGVETIVSSLGQVLIKAGYRVDVATLRIAERTSTEYCGMNIISLDDCRSLEPSGIPCFTLEAHRLIASGQYDACVLFADPLSWLLPAMLLGTLHPDTKLYIQLLVNQEGYDKWRHHQTFKERLLKTLIMADGCLALTRNGNVAEYMRSIGIQPLYLPNATTPEPVSLDFRSAYAIPDEIFLMVHLANVWRVKNHLGLLQSLSSIPSHWKLVLIGQPFDKNDPEEEENKRRFEEIIQNRPNILYIPGLSPKDVGAALKAADVVLLASHAEISPMAIVEAMSYGTPWLATPECGDVAEKAGGIVAPLKLFPLLLTLLQQQPEFRRALGKAGFAHWQACYSWDVVAQGWIEVLEKGSLSRTFEMPKDVAEQMNSLEGAFKTYLSDLMSQSCDPNFGASLNDNCKTQPHDPLSFSLVS